MLFIVVLLVIVLLVIVLVILLIVVLLVVVLIHVYHFLSMLFYPIIGKIYPKKKLFNYFEIICFTFGRERKIFTVINLHIIGYKYSKGVKLFDKGNAVFKSRNKAGG